MAIRKNKKNKNSGIRNYAKYSSLAFEMLGIIFLGTIAGVKLDEKFSQDFPLFTIILSPLSVIIALYLVLRDFIKKK